MQRVWEQAVTDSCMLHAEDAMKCLTAAPTKLKRMPRTPLKAAEQIGKLCREANEETQTESEKWLRDNEHYLRQISVQLEQKQRKLPVIQQGWFAGEARAYVLMVHALADGAGTVSEQSLQRTLESYLQYRELTLREWEELPNLLRLAAMELLGGIAAELLREKKLRAGAEKQTAAQLEETRGTLSADQAKNVQRSPWTADLIRSLRSLEELDFRSIFERTSRVYGVCMQDSIYRKMERESKDFYLSQIERIAEKTGQEETNVVQEAWRLAQKKQGIQAHIGYYLLCDGKPTLFQKLGGRCAAPKETTQKRKLLYFGSILSLTLLSTAALVWGAVLAGGGLLEVLACFAFGAVLFFGAAQEVVNRLTARMLPPKFLPKMEFQTLPNDCKTVLVMPVAVLDEKELKRHFDALMAHACAFPEANGYVLLMDFLEAPVQTVDADARLIHAGIAAVDACNARYGKRFTFAYRLREHAPKEGKWMAFDRKRGALLALNRALRGQENSLQLHGAPLCEQARYVITLDADTKLCTGEGKKLVCAMAHPLNRTQGYGIMQPRLATQPEKSGSRMTIFYAADGMDFYAQAISDAYMDVTGEGTYAGKGIYDIDLFDEAVADRVKPGTALSHDLLEGCLADTAYVGDVQAVESFPKTYSAWIKREHRWVRGDWQLLPYLLGLAKDQHGIRVRLSFTDRWKMIDNLRRSLVGLVATQLFAVGATMGTQSFLLYSLVSFLPYWFSPFLGLMEAVAVTVLRGYRMGAATLAALWQRTKRGLSGFILCAFEADIYTDAITKALWRVFISKKNLMEWMTATQAEKGDARTVFGYYRMMLPALVLDILLSVITLQLAPERFPFTAVVCAVWALSPVYAGWLDGTPPLPKQRDAYLHHVAAQTWKFFAAYANSRNHFFAPDNVQLVPKRNEVRRTSPTNIGFSLLAPISAMHLGLIQQEEMIKRVAETVNSIQSVQKWNGHLYNWYSTETLEVLHPYYISTVDSGNLAACLWVAAEAVCKEAPAVAEQARMLVKEMDFSKLYHPARKLFSIGYDPENGKLSESYYDLYESEARLTGFLAIAKGDVPAEHWKHLGRPAARAFGENAILSWSGTMFEYLMPALFLTPRRKTFELQGQRAAMRVQMRYARQRDVPFGISESGYYALDAAGYYQYRAFGVPHLSVRPMLRHETVVSPYSSALAAMLDCAAARKNMKRLEEMGAAGEYGFYEAVDLTDKGGGAIVRSFMAHHQGMTLTALDNVLNKGGIRNLFEQVPEVQAAIPLVWQKEMKTVAPKWERRAAGKQTIPKPKAVWHCKPAAVPQTAVLSGGGYTLYITQNGSGGAYFDGKSVYRASKDGCLEEGGVRLYVRMAEQNLSPTYLPTRPHGAMTASFMPHQVTHGISTGKLSVRMNTCVDPGTGTELRMITLQNKSAKDVEAEVCAAMEPVCMPEKDDAAHPAFANLFLRTDEREEVLLCERRPRDRKEHKQCVFMALFTNQPSIHLFETDKAKFVGRCGNYRTPKGLKEGMMGTTGAVINPVLASQRKVTVPAGKKVTFVLAIGIANTPEDAVKAALTYREISAGKRAFVAAENYAKAQLGRFGLSGGEMLRCYELASSLLLQKQKSTPKGKGREKLFAAGVSGDLPVKVLSLREGEDGEKLRKALRCHAFLSERGLHYDLIIADMCGNAYVSPAREKLSRMLAVFHGGMRGMAGGIHVLATDQQGFEELIYSANAKTNESTHAAPKRLEPIRGKRVDLSISPLLLENQFGGFAKTGNEYEIRLAKEEQTPMPWANILANESFGTVVTERGAGYTWAQNAREYKITCFQNDPVLTGYSEVLYVQDQSDRTVFCPLGGPVRPGRLVVNHGFGYSRYQTGEGGIGAQATVFTDAELPAKIVCLRLRNTTQNTRNLTATYIADFTLSAANEPQEGRVRLRYCEADRAVRANNGFESGFSEETVFFAGRGGETTHTLGRDKVFGCCASVQAPLCMTAPLENDDEGDGAAALRVAVAIQPHEEKTVWFVLGAADDAKIGHVLECLEEEKQVWERLEQTKARWKERTQAIRVHTGNVAFDVMVNGWMAYQVYASRLLGRTGFYQPGGAFGFRDQLQDAVAMLPYQPQVCREMILLCCAHQFEAGDVQHWWHPPARGVRTRISDDRLFLPYAVAQYIQRTGDTALLDISVPYLAGEALGDRDDAYFPARQAGKGTVYQHCMRALYYSVERTGEHGLPLMGSGDWNDGMNLAGRKGKGESVWLGWFLYDTLQKFLPYLREDAAPYQSFLQELRQNLEKTFQNDRYIRAYLDDGTPLGDGHVPECAIDLLSQAWAALSHAGEHANTAMDTALRELLDREAGIWRLLWPPFDSWEAEVGYIQGYLPGFRENGGQYTHAAAWGICALCELGRKQEAKEIYDMLNPAGKDTERYRTEPYVYAGDVYSVFPNAGRGGWSWYTGSAGWMLRAAVEWLMGISIREGEVHCNGAPFAFEATVKTEKGVWEIKNTTENCKIFPIGFDKSGK